MICRASVCAVLVLAALPAVSAQGTAGSQSRDRQLETARRAIAGGQPVIALRAIEPLIAKTPGDRDVVAVAIDASLSMNDTIGANAYYDRFVQATTTESAVLLKPIALRALQTIVAGSAHDPRLRAEALERMSRGGDAGAATSLRQGAGQGRQALLADAALARLGDRTAADRLSKAAASTDPGGKTAEAEAIRLAGDRAMGPLLVPLLKHNDPYTRIAAIEAIGALGYAEAVPDLKAIMAEPYIEFRSKAALALARLGDSSGRDIVAAMLRSPVPDVRLAALEVDTTMPAAERLLIIRPILADPDPLNRVKAAEALAKIDPADARSYLLALMKHPDVTPRREAARVLETLTPADLSLFRVLMSDPERWVRLYGAGGVLRAAAQGLGQ